MSLFITFLSFFEKSFFSRAAIVLAALLLIPGQPTAARATDASAWPLTAALDVWISSSNSVTVVLGVAEGGKIPRGFLATDWIPMLDRALGTSLHPVDGKTFSNIVLPGRSVMATASQIGSRQSLLTRTGQIDQAPLLPTLRKMGFVWLTVNLMPQKLPLVQVRGARTAPYNNRQFAFYYSYVSTKSLHPTPIRYTIGYPASWENRIPGVYCLLLLPVLLTLWARNRALRAQNSGTIDPAVIWFGYARFLGWLTTGTWILWIGALVTLHVSPLLSFIIEMSLWTRASGLVIWAQYVPALVLVLCSALSEPVFAKVRGLEYTRADLVRQSVWGQARFFCFACFGIALLDTSIDSRLSVCWVLMGIISFSLASQAITKSMGTAPAALTVGELRNRIFALGQRAGVNVLQIYVLPSGKGRMANAFAASGNRVLLTDYLLEHLSKREVDAVVAHELTHLKRRHPQALMLNWLAIFVAANFVLNFLGRKEYAEGLIGLAYIATMAFGLFLTYFMSRRFEWVADAGAVNLTRDPEACITGLAKLARLNMTPLQWGKLAGNWLTHPATLHRLEAMAKIGNLPPGRVQEILDSPDNLTEQRPELEPHYPVPTVQQNTFVFSTQFKGRFLGRLFRGNQIVGAVVPALTVLLVESLALQGVLRWSLYAVGLFLTVLARRIFVDRANMKTYRFLEKALLQKFALEANNQNSTSIPTNADFIGLSPSATSRLYENIYDWDLGFIWFQGDVLRYHGEQDQFELCPENIIHVESRADSLAWWKWHRVFITWRTGENTATFYLRPGASGSQRASRHATQDFVQKLEEWRKQAASLSSEDGLGKPNAELKSPQLGAVTSQSPKKLCSPINIALNLILQGIVTLFVCVLCSIPLVHGGIEGYYVLGASLLALLFDFAPIFLYREPKMGA